GRDLYDRLRRPPRVLLEERLGEWQLVPLGATEAAGSAVMRRPGTIPRITLGRERHEALHLGEGPSPALVLEGKPLCCYAAVEPLRPLARRAERHWPPARQDRRATRGRDSVTRSMSRSDLPTRGQAEAWAAPRRLARLPARHRRQHVGR